MSHSTTLPPPGEGLKTEKMPGHWVLARLGKRVLRPGGMELTKGEEWLADNPCCPNGSLSRCCKISLLCVGHETKHGFRPVVRLAIGDEG